MISLIIGGSGSGKSEYAESLCIKEPGKYLYIATMEPFGEEGRAKIRRHHQLRSGKGFETVECYTNLEALKSEYYDVILLECVSNLVANELYSQSGSGLPQSSVVNGVIHLSHCCSSLVIVTNNTCEDLQEYSKEMIHYQKELGEVNQKLADISDQVIEIHCGRPLIYKESRNECNS